MTLLQTFDPWWHPAEWHPAFRELYIPFNRSLLLKKEAGWHAARLTVAISMPTPLQQSSAGKAAQICINRYLKCLEISRKLGKDIAQQPKQTTTVWHRPEHSQLPLYTKPRTPHPPPVAYLTALSVSACAKAAPWIPLNVSSPKERLQVMSNPPAWLTMSGSFVVCLSPLIHFVWFNGYVAQQLSLQPVLREGQHVLSSLFLSLSLGS